MSEIKPVDPQLLRELANVLDYLQQEYHKKFWVDSTFLELSSFDKIDVIDEHAGVIGFISRSTGKLEFTKA